MLENVNEHGRTTHCEQDDDSLAVSPVLLRFHGNHNLGSHHLHRGASICCVLRQGGKEDFHVLAGWPVKEGQHTQTHR